jgi:tRNA(Ile)-lysidine synthase
LGVRWIATGHTQDDQSETILHRLLRGTGLQGLRGMPERRPLVSPEIELVRPLLGIRRRKVLEYLEAENQKYRVDASNQDLRLTRNRIRHELIPLMESFNPEFASLLSGLAEQAGEAWQREQQRAQDLLSQVELRASGGEVILKTHALRELSDADLREVYRLVWRRQNWPERQMSFRHWQDLADLSRLDSAARDFPGRVHFRNRGKVITLALR